MITAQPRRYHIHIDGTTFPEVLAREARRIGFYETNFSGHPEGFQHFEPKVHLTLKAEGVESFNAAWSELEKVASAVEWKGYIEGEFIPFDDELPWKEYVDVPVPFKLERRRLRSEEDFRQTEVHVVMDKDASDARLMRGLLEAGLYGAYLPKQDHTALVLTAQGYKADIFRLSGVLRKYLASVGGAARCTLKEERAIRYKLFNLLPEELPEIVDCVQYF